MGHGIRQLRVCPGPDLDYRPDRIVNRQSSIVNRQWRLKACSKAKQALQAEEV
jgi:hypothetical protein